MGRMTDVEESKDLSRLAPHDAPSDALTRPGLAATLFVGIAIAIAADVVVDALEGASIAHMFVEIVVTLAAVFGASLLLRDLKRARDRTRRLAEDLVESRRRAERHHRDAERYRADAAELVRGLGEAIDRQLERWGLTDAEKEVAVLLLKGLSHKEVAAVRETSERTARGQARSVYRKAGLESRAALSAFFLEDLLPPSASSR